MRTHQDVQDEERTGRDGWFVAAAETIGDLDNPFYEEERRRDVWNEASAVGLQATLWLATAAATAMVWIGGATALPYAAAVLAVVGVAAGVTIAYAARLGVRADEATRVLRLRLVPYAALWTVFLVGALRAAPDDGFGGGFASGAGIGAGIAFVGLVVAAVRARRDRGR